MNKAFLYKIGILFLILLIVVFVSWFFWSGKEGLSSLNDTELPTQYSHYYTILKTMTGNNRVGDAENYSLDALYATVATIDASEASLTTIENYANSLKQFYGTLDSRYEGISQGMNQLDTWNRTNIVIENSKEAIESLLESYDNSNNFLDTEYDASVISLQKNYDTSLNQIQLDYHASLEQADVNYNYNILMYESTPEYTNLGSKSWFQVLSSFALDPTESSSNHLLECQNQCNNLDISCSGIELVKGALPYCNLLSAGMKQIRQWNVDDPELTVYQKNTADTSSSMKPVDAARVRNAAYETALQMFQTKKDEVKVEWNNQSKDLYENYLSSKEALFQSVTNVFTGAFNQEQPVKINLSDDDYRQMYQLVAEMRFFIVSIIDDMIPLVKRNLDISPLDFTTVDLESFMEHWSLPLSESFISSSAESIRFPSIPLNLGQQMNTSTLEAYPLQPKPQLNDDTSTSMPSWSASNPVPYKKYANVQYEGSPLLLSTTQGIKQPVDCAMTCSDPDNICVGFNYDKQQQSCTFFDNFRTTAVVYDYPVNQNKDLYYSGTLHIPPKRVEEPPSYYEKRGPLTNWNGKPGYLHPTEKLLSDSGKYAAYMSPSGDLQVADVRYGGWKVLWSLTRGGGMKASELEPNSSLVVSPTGDLIIYDYLSTSGEPLWTAPAEDSFPTSFDNPYREVRVMDNGALVMFKVVPTSAT